MQRTDTSEGGARQAVWLVALGVLLGVAYNHIGLEAKPSFGIPWLYHEEALPSLEALSGGSDGQSGDGSGLAAADQTDDPMAVFAAPSPEQAAGLPEIPDLGRPIQVQLPAVKKFVDAGAALVVDAREPDEYAEGHIPGAINLPYDDVIADPARLEALDTGGRPIITYCGGGMCELSMNLAYALIEAGHRKVLVFTGGFPEWVEAGYPVARGPAPGGPNP